MTPGEKDLIDGRSIKVVPSKRQLALQQMEFYAFVHYTVNTFTGKEWGDGTESESVFAPARQDVMQWAGSIAAAGMRGAILTCKHHDGFCLWPSAYTSHTVANSPYKNGKGDVVAEFSEACRAYGLKFGIYLSPWDRNCAFYGQGKAYDDFYIGQLTELLTNYGPIFAVWFDGACGEGPDGKLQSYDWERYYELIRSLQPEACIHVCGPDIRWCGNEAGYTRKSEWSVVPERTRDTEKIKENSQSEDSERFRQRKIRAQDEDLGSREAIADEESLIWYPAEVNTSIRPGWFYHEEEDDRVKSLEELIGIYENAVGGNATFLLNIPPDRNGLFHERDVERLKELGDSIRSSYRYNLLEEAGVRPIVMDTQQSVSGVQAVEAGVRTSAGDARQAVSGMQVAEADMPPGTAEARYLTADNYEKSCILRPGDSLFIKWEEEKNISRIVLKEDITKSQRIEAFLLCDGQGRELYRGTVVGYKKIIRLKECRTDTIVFRLLDSRREAYLSFVGIYGD